MIRILQQLPLLRQLPLLGLALAGAALAQHPAAPAAPAAPAMPAFTNTAPAAAPAPRARLPALNELKVDVPRPVRAATAAFGLGRQRLALVIGLGMVGNRAVVDSAPRDVQALAAALAAGGFVVMRREDVSAADLRAALNEFRQRLQPGALGFLYVTGLGAQVDGQNLLLARDARLDPDTPAADLPAHLKAHSVAVSELVDALHGPAGSPRLLVVDAAYAHPLLARLPRPGLAEPNLPPGVMALFGQPIGAWREVPAVAPLPSPAPADARAIAASRFARVLIDALAKPGVNGPTALRSARRVLAEGGPEPAAPWIGGDTAEDEEFAQLSILDALLPRTPEDAVREGFKQLAQKTMQPTPARGGEQSVAEVLKQAGSDAVAPAPDSALARQPEAPRANLPDASHALGNAGSALGTAASVAGAALTVGATVASVAAGVKLAEAAVVAQAATTAVGVATSAATAAGQRVALAAGPGSVAAAAAAAPALAMPVPAVAAPAAASVATPAAAPAAAPALPAATAAGAARPPLGELLVSAASAVAGAPATQPQTPSSVDGRTTRAGGQGERPYYQPRKNPFGLAEGDTFTYEVTDTWKGQVSGRYTTAIDVVLDNGQLLANGQQVALDPQGRLKSIRRPDGSASSFQPHEDLWWADPKTGQKRDLEFTETFRRADGVRGSMQYSGSGRVGRARKLATPAGEFEVLPIQSSGWWTERIGNARRVQGKWYRTVYYAPKLGQPVAIEIEDVDSLGRLLKRERIELQHAQTTRGGAP